ncbi:bifunctional 5,10-methylenetetrahydrofolate dehydrogenase/5,10-methenyltetrahydrofolate cyclohydrolase [Peptostreptococcus equinus]|uniref:Bifunctional protein FolD n=1 Tax=Peptostreptococcus equinus TaxID=3003601 RepID=A0ABY7JP93_9FIRM|nr:bifunctional 5,10-methylenetetrahydrofolate dehydrogenase/5,10-methenyltetrahydrofolate cyclohydrolase [Peptostreptococcus sp. CBA3647]WAW15193.1 bifunctional 5,10-methylenetetrahydrofolate dehydrogenase/5,10-methenyltetrahydrofolate cyclohydrolase [Peptostreptococcus sp. CBA3647]
MEEKLMLGKTVAEHLTDNIKVKVEDLKSKNINPKLAILKLGSRKEDDAYQRGAISRCEKCGIETEIVELSEQASQEEYIEALDKLNKDNSIHGILCFRPLPKHIDEEVVKYHIAENKDVDCFSPINFAKLMSNDETGFAPCTPMAVIETLKFYKVDLQGKNICVLGRSMVVGKPLSMLLLNEDASVTICHSKTKDLNQISSNADIIVSCMGRAKMIDSSYIGTDSIAVDVGINFDKNGKMCGDINLDDVMDKVSMITPVPRGIGAVTSTILAQNTLKACMQKNNIK